MHSIKNDHVTQTATADFNPHRMTIISYTRIKSSIYNAIANHCEFQD